MNTMATEQVTRRVILAAAPEPTPWEKFSGGRLHGTRGSVARMTPIPPLDQRDADLLDALAPTWKKVQNQPSQSGHGLT